MSKSIANAIYKLDKSLIFLLSKRQKDRVFSRIREKISNDSVATLETDRGSLMFDRLTSAHVASAVDRFHEDEPEMLEWIKSFDEGDIFWDVGANIGIFTLYAALDRNITVCAFEPCALNYSQLVSHLELNKLDKHVTALCVAFSDKTSIEHIYMRHRVPGTVSSLSEPVSQFGEYDAAYEQAIISYKMDEFQNQFQLPQPDHIKIDVDGLEPEIILSGITTISRAKSLMVEVEGDNSLRFDKNIVGTLEHHGFRENTAIRDQGHHRNRLYIRE